MAKKLTAINPGDPQPMECPFCGGFHGYQITDNIRTSYTTQYFSSGQHEGGFYSDFRPVVKHGKEAFCQNCGKKLPIKVNISNDIHTGI